jgi:hypothetical protein
MKRKIIIAQGILLTFVAIGAIPAGFSMIIQPDGSGLGLTTDLLKNSPFPDFLIPGLFLFFVNGVLNLAVAILSFLNSRFSGVSAMLLGAALVAWICVQVYYISLSSFMQPMFFLIGLAEVVLGMVIIFNNPKEEIILGTE